MMSHQFCELVGRDPCCSQNRTQSASVEFVMKRNGHTRAARTSKLDVTSFLAQLDVTEFGEGDDAGAA